MTVSTEVVKSGNSATRLHTVIRSERVKTAPGAFFFTKLKKHIKIKKTLHSAKLQMMSF